MARQPEVQPGEAPQGLTAEDWATMQDLMREAEYQFTYQVSDGEWAYRAPNRAHDFSISLAADGLHASRNGAEGVLLWDLSFSLAAYGDQVFPASIAERGLIGSRERVEYHWSRDVVGWVENSADGVAHGLTLAAPPPGAEGSAVELTFALGGSLTPELDRSGRALRLKDCSGNTVLLYDQLAVHDAAGRSLPARFSLTPERESQAEGARLHITIDTARAAYPLTVVPLLHSQVTKLTGSDSSNYAEFGFSVAISGDTVVIGAHQESGTGNYQGAAYVFERNHGEVDSWGQVTKLTSSDAENLDWFGSSVAISGDTIVVGASREDGAGSDRGAAYVFERNQDGADSWGEVEKLIASDAADDDYFGASVAISGDTVVVGADGEDGGPGDPLPGAGAAYVYERNQGGPDNWGEVTKLTASDGLNGDWFGHRVAISGDTVVVGAQYDNGAGWDRGSAYVYERNQDGVDSWGEVTKLTASDDANSDFFGRSVAISGDTIVVGADGEDGGPGDPRPNAGAAYVFERNQDGADAWGEVEKLTASDAENDDRFGASVAISGDTVVVGASGEDGAGEDYGAAYVFERNQGGADSWGQVQKLTGSDAEDDDRLGVSVAISGDTVVVGAFWEDGAGDNRGAAYVFVGRGQWQEVAIPRASDAQNNDLFGYSVAISGDTVVVGAYGEDGGGSNRGAAYVFTRNQGGADGWGQVRKLTASVFENDIYFGVSVAISGDTIVVGAHYEDGDGADRGAAYVFERNRTGPDNWGQVEKLTASDAGDEDHFGNSVSISGDTIVVGASGEDGVGDDYGAVYVFERNQGGGPDTWGEVEKLTASVPENDAFFGISVAISGDTIVVGASGVDGGGSNRGAAYIFTRNQDGADKWGWVFTLTPSDPQNSDNFGVSVAISGDTVVVGANAEDGGTGNPRPNAGAAYLFERNRTAADHWGQVTKLTASDTEAHDWFGFSVAISGDTVVVGAYYEDGAGSDRGAAYVFERNQGGPDTWGEVVKLTASDDEDDDQFGRSVAISGGSVVVGAYYEDGAGSAHGAAYVFLLQPYRVYLPLVMRNW